MGGLRSSCGGRHEVTAFRSQTWGPTTLLRHLFIWISVGVITKEGARRGMPPGHLQDSTGSMVSFAHV